MRGLCTLEFLAQEYQVRTGESISTHTVKDWFEERNFVTGRMFLKPALSDLQRLDRLEFIKEKIGNGKSFNQDWYRIYVDEKWFYVTRDNKLVRYDPDDPYEAERV